MLRWPAAVATGAQPAAIAQFNDNTRMATVSLLVTRTGNRHLCAVPSIPGVRPERFGARRVIFWRGRDTFGVRFATFRRRRAMFELCRGMFEACRAMFETGRAMFEVCRAMFEVCRGMFEVRRGMFEVRRATFGMILQLSARV